MVIIKSYFRDADNTRIVYHVKNYLNFMIRLQLDKLLKARGMSAYRLSKESGIHPNVIGKYRQNQVKAMSLETLDQLCKALRCVPGDLIEYFPDRIRT